MRLIIAILRPAQVETARQSLSSVHVTRMTIGDAHGYGFGGGADLAQEAVMEIAVNDDFVTRTVDTLAALVSAAGDVASDRVFVVPMDQAVQIYRDVRGPEAI